MIAGGVLTVNIPYFARMSGIIPTLAIFAAIPLNKLAAEIVSLSGSLEGARGLARLARRAVQTAVAAGLLSLREESEGAIRRAAYSAFDRLLQVVEPGAPGH